MSEIHVRDLMSSNMELWHGGVTGVMVLGNWPRLVSKVTWELRDVTPGLVQIIITPLLSDIYAWSLMSASGYTSSESTPWYLWSIRFIAYPLTIWLVICQDSTYCGALSRLDILIGKWVPLRHCLLGLHVTLCMNGTWSCHSNGQQYAQEIMEGCGTSSGLDVLTGKWLPLQCHQTQLWFRK